MKIDTRDLVSVSDASTRGVSWLVAEASEGRNIVLLKHNRAAAVVAGTDVMERLQHIDEREENFRLLVAAMARVATDSGGRHTLEDVAAEFGVDLDDDSDIDPED